jgi:hypothetical protein
MLKRLSLVVFLFASSDVALSQEPPKAPQVEPKQHPDSGLKAQEDRGQQAAPASHPLAGVPEISANGGDRKSQSKAKERSEQGTEFWSPLYGYSLKVTDTLLVSITFLLFLATLALWLATRKLVRGAEDTAERQLRAYVTVIGGSLCIQNKTIHGVLELKNSGQTPAYELTIWSQMKIQPSDETFVEEPPRHDDSTLAKIVVGPGSTTNPRDRLEIPADNDISLPAIRNGKAWVYIWGRIDYRDAFKCKRFAEFRLRSHYLESDKHFVFACTPEGNKAD